MRGSDAFDELLDRSARALEAVGRSLDDADAFARIVLGALAEPGDGVMGRAVAQVGAVATAHALLARPDVAALAALLPAEATVTPKTISDALARWMPRLDAEAILRSLAQAARVGAALLVPGDPDWPIGVDDLGVHTPLALWVRGRTAAIASSAPAIALVGARAATGYGEHVAIEASAGLVDRGFTVVSGGAYGIDGMAHRSALRSAGSTVAFLAGGIDRFYPLGHDDLLSRIVQTGAVVSEVPCGSSPTKWRFLQRNRLIAAASAATVVIEAGHRSGSLNTANHASALGRPIGAVPGPVTSPVSAGCHRLLRERDAICVVNAAQMAELAGGTGAHGALRLFDDPAGAARGGPPGPSAHPDAVRVLDALSPRSPRSVDDVARLAGVEPARVMGVLGILEIEGRAARRPNGWVARRAAG
ncbi:DNA-processing protein DprA [Agromyces larvae]|uniref:DNA-processing protein DprA n=1 Tax=Agromyces larvae TaxID=2929802 RepID=A0ABY4C9K8_9MICO|nr:DNA-processing protein DprA [Agromyces larvae]UOE45355.1 DNA-processing protein DprA [Agromyces larvae]